MDQDFDDGELRSLSEGVLPLTSISYTNNTSSHHNTRNHSIKLQKSISSDNQTFHEEILALPIKATMGDVSDHTRKKHNGSLWRWMFSKSDYSDFIQRRGLYKPCLAVLLNNMRKKYDGPVPADPTCMIFVDGSLEYQNRFVEKKNNQNLIFYNQF